MAGDVRPVEKKEVGRMHILCHRHDDWTETPGACSQGVGPCACLSAGLDFQGLRYEIPTYSPASLALPSRFPNVFGLLSQRRR